MAEVLAIAMSHRNNVRADGDELAACLLLACAAARAHGQTDLVPRASLISVLAEDEASHR
jgi:hypothetical protein